MPLSDVLGVVCNLTVEQTILAVGSRKPKPQAVVGPFVGLVDAACTPYVQV
jgi:hypothetical protein